jgi:TPR repeat protein
MRVFRRILPLVLVLSAACNGSPQEDGVSPTADPAPDKPAETQPSTPNPADVASCKTKDESACAKACDAGDVASCATLGRLALKKSAPNEKAKCEASLRKACEGGIGNACAWMSSCLMMIELNGGAAASKEESTAFNVKACDLNDGGGCFNAGKALEDGYGVPADPAKGAELIAKAFKLLQSECDSGSGDSCFQLAMQRDPETRSKRLPKDKAVATTLYEQACKAGVEMACGRGAAK